MTIQGQQLVELVRQFTQIDTATLPAPIFLGALRRALIGRGFTAPDAEMIASRMKVEVSIGAMTAEQLEEIAGYYGDLLSKIAVSLRQQGFVEPMRALQEMAREMTLTCK